MLASGIDVDDQKLTIFIPEVHHNTLEKSLHEELQNIEPHLCHCYKITPISQPFTIQRESQKAGAGSSIYYVDSNGPNSVTAGALFLNLNDKKVYILTTCHLDDAPDKLFYFKYDERDVLLGRCMAFVCQTNPVIEACLVELTQDSLEICSPLLSNCDATAMAVYSGPYRGSLEELLAAPKEVMKCGASSGITRGKMKYFAYDFPDLSTNTMIYGGIVTLPLDKSQQFSQPGDSGSIISTAVAQTYLVNNLGMDYNENDMAKRDIRTCPLDGDNTLAKVVAEQSTTVRSVLDPAVQEQTLLKTCNEEVHKIEVMAHEALSVHCFGYHMNVPEYGRVRASISFRVNLAMEKLGEQIKAELVILPILNNGS